MCMCGCCGVPSTSMTCPANDVFMMLQTALWRLLTSLSMSTLLLQAGIFAGAGVNKIRLTGGEPTLRRDLVELTGALRMLPGVNGVGLTTNGLTLPRKLEALQAAGEL